MIYISNAFTKYKNTSVQARASLWYSACGILQKGISFIVIPIYTRLLSTSEYGQYIVFQSWRDIIIIFATLNLYCGIFTKAMVDYEDDRNRYTSSMQGLSTIITTLFLLVYFISPSYWSRVLDMGGVTILLLFAYYYTYPALAFWSVRQRVEYKYIKMVVVTLIIAVLTPLISICLLLFSSLRSESVIWGFLLVQVAFGAYFYIYNFIRGKVFYIKKYWLHALKFNIPLIPHYLSLIVLGQADRIMIKSMCGVDKAGIYGLAYSVSQLMIIFISAINGSMVPWIYEQLKKRNYNSVGKVSNKLCVALGIMTCGAILISPEIIMILGGHEYYEAIWVIPIVTLRVYYTFCYVLFSNVEFYYNATKYVMVASLVGAVLNIVLNYLFIPIFGYIAAAYTTLGCYTLFMIMHYLFMKKVCRKVGVNRDIFDVKFMSISCIALLILMLLCMLTYKALVIRYSIIAVIVIAMIWKRKQIRSLIKDFR